MRTYRIASVVLTCGCVQAAGGEPPPVPADPHAILAAAGDSVLASGPPRALFTADAATADALAEAAHRWGVRLASSPGEVWCEGEPAAGRTVGTVVALAVDGIAGDRAAVRWSATCLRTLPGQAAPVAFGEGGVYEVRRVDGRWRVTRAVVGFSF